MTKTTRIPPHASILIESMRDIGYSLDTALADIIDNSVTAGAKSIDLFVETSGPENKLAIVDDGDGMTGDELLDAMRPGSQNPLDSREAGDLGRFGLGLKTASFSQCRRLTVLTRKNGQTSCARWDLDIVAKQNDWLVELPEDAASIPWHENLGDKGTLVLWERLDRLSDEEDTIKASSDMVRRIDDAVEHLQLVFHRFLAGEPGSDRLSISVNNHALEPFDPFHSRHPATIAGPLETIRVRGHDVTVRTFTLPHHKKVTSAEWDRYAGRAGYLKNQGFYVYRAKRLIIHGTWFGLAKQAELSKLARVQIDMPNQLDADWKIDVKKASAQPPYQVRERLRRIIETIGATSKRVYTGRGKRLVDDSRLPVWNRVQEKNEISYRINKDHPVVERFSKQLSESMRSEFEKIIELASAAVPIDSLFADSSGNPDKLISNKMLPKTYEYIVETTFRQLLDAGISRDDIINMLESTEPFRSNWAMTEQILGDVEGGTSVHE